jgi:ABC-type glycerol-3-phosphate transport system substrate-binding protein
MKRTFLSFIVGVFVVNFLFILVAGAQEKVELTFYTIRTDEETWVKPLIQKFEELNPHITVKHFAAERIRYDEMVRTAIAGGSPVDVLEIDGQFTRAYQRDGLIEDMKKWYDFKNRFFPAAVEAVTSKGEILMVPNIGLTVCGFYTNDSVFEKYGLSAPQTWDDIQAIHDKLRDTGINTLTYSAGKIWWMPMLLFLTLPSFTDQPVEFTMDTLYGKVKWNDPVYIQAYQLIIDFVQKGWLMKESLGYDIDGAVQDFIQGKAAMLYQGIWANDLIEKTMPEDFKYSFHNVPVRPGFTPRPAGGPGQGLTICSRSKHKEEAAEFIKFLTTDENATFMVNRQGEYHGVIAANEKSEKMKKSPVFAAGYKLLPKFMVFLDWLWEPEITSEFQVQIQAALAGQVTAEELGKIIQDKYEELREEGRTYFRNLVWCFVGEQ